MKKNRRYRISALAAAVCLLCLNTALALAGEVGLKPLEDDEKYFQEYYLSEPDLSLPLPIDADIQILMDEPGQHALFIGDPDYSETPFAFFALKNSELNNLDFSNLDEKGLRSVLETISPRAQTLSYTILENFLPGVRALRVQETADGFYSEHLVAVKGEWVLNMMTQSMTGADSIPDESAEYQETFLLSVLERDGFFARYQRYTLPDSTITLSVPDSVYLRLATKSPDFLEIVLSPRREGTQIGALHVFAVRDAAYQNQTVLTLNETVKNEALTLPTFQKAYDADSLQIIEEFEDGKPVLAYESDESSKHLMAVKDDWALYVSRVLEPERIDPTWINNAQAELMHQLLGSKAVLSDWLPAYPVKQEGNILKFPLQSRIIDITIPEGYGVDVAKDTSEGRSVYFYALDGSPNYFHIASISAPRITGEASLDMYTQAEQQELCASTSESIEAMGPSAQSTMIAKGPTGVAAVYTTTEEQVYEQYFWTMDSNSVSISFSSEDGEITADETAVLKGLILQ